MEVICVQAYVQLYQGDELPEPKSMLQASQIPCCFMVALWNRETIYIFMLWFVLSFFFFIFFSSPYLSRRRLDVCHTSTHGVALVRI